MTHPAEIMEMKNWPEEYKVMFENRRIDLKFMGAYNFVKEMMKLEAIAELNAERRR